MFGFRRRARSPERPNDAEEACPDAVFDAPDSSQRPEPDSEDLARGPIEIPITDTLDLHPFRPREIREVAISFLEAAHEEGLRELRLIHGRGTGTQRNLVRTALERHPLVASFSDDPGNWGATRVRLRETDSQAREQGAGGDSPSEPQ